MSCRICHRRSQIRIGCRRLWRRTTLSFPLTVCPMPNRLPICLMTAWKLERPLRRSFHFLLYTDFLYARPVSGLPSVLQQVPSDRESVAFDAHSARSHLRSQVKHTVLLLLCNSANCSSFEAHGQLSGTICQLIAALGRNHVRNLTRPIEAGTGRDGFVIK